MLLGLNLPLVGLWVRLLKVPYRYLAVVVVVICVVGAYSVSNSVFDVGVMVAFGVFGYLLRKAGLPSTPLILAHHPGTYARAEPPAVAYRLGGDLLVFFRRPISATLLVVAGLLMLSPLVKIFWRRSHVLKTNR